MLFFRACSKASHFYSSSKNISGWLLLKFPSKYFFHLSVSRFNASFECAMDYIQTTQQTQDVNWTYIRRSEDVQDVFWTSYVRSIYVLCLRGICPTVSLIRKLCLFQRLYKFNIKIHTNTRTIHWHLSLIEFDSRSVCAAWLKNFESQYFLQLFYSPFSRTATQQPFLI